MKLLSLPLITAACVSAFAAPAHAFDLTGESDGSTIVRSDPSSEPSLLQDFFFWYHGGVLESDHHIQRVAVLSDYPRPDKTFIQFRDKNADDDYSYAISQLPLRIPGAVVGRVAVDDSSRDRACLTRGACQVRLDRPSGDYVFALRGFRLQYLDGDHEIDRITILEQNGLLSVAFNDRNDDDRFGWEVEYAWIPRSAIVTTGTSSGYDSHEGTASPGTGRTSVLSGFDVDFASGDNDLKALAIKLSSYVRVLFTDAGYDKPFYWRVNFVRLR